jgi:sugar phosphate isomerase/epimerase
LVFGSPKNRFIINKNLNNQETFINFFKKMGDYIGDNNLKICIENNSKLYNCNFLNTINEVSQIVKKINHKNIAMMVDVGNCLMENDNIEDMLINKKYIKHIHISKPFLDYFINYNVIYYNNFMKILKKMKYNEIITLEFVGKNDLNNFITSLKNFKYFISK